MECKATANVKSILLGLVELEAIPVADVEASIVADAGNIASLTPAQVSDLGKRMAKSAAIKQKIANTLGQDDTAETGTRNNVGSTIKAIRDFTGRNMLAEARAALEREIAARNAPPLEAPAEDPKPKAKGK